MRLRKYDVEGLAQLERETIVFRDDGPTVIIGPNEAGKTHLMLALCGMFFGLEHPVRMKPWHGPSTMHGSLEFDDDAGTAVRLERDYTDDSVTVHTGDTRWTARWDGKQADTERFLRALDEWFGSREQSIFTATAFLRQGELTALDMKSVAPEIQRLMTGSMTAGYDPVLANLRGGLDGLRRPMGVRKEGRRERQEEVLRGLEAGRRAARERQDRILRLRQIRERLAGDLEQKMAQEGRLKEQVDLIGNVDGLASRQSQLQKQVERLDGQLQSFERGRAALDAAVRERDRYASAAGASRDELIEYDRNVREVESALERLAGPSAAGKTLRPRFLLKPREEAPPPDLSPEELTDLIWKAREARDGALRQMNVATLSQALELRDRYDRATAEVQKARALVDTLGSETDVLNQREAAARELGTVTEELDRLATTTIDSKHIQNRDTFRKTLISLQDAIDVLRNDAAEVERKLQLEAEGEEDVMRIDREIEQVRRDFRETDRLIAVHELAIGTLTECVTRFGDHFLDGVMVDASAMFAELTGGRYSRVSLREGDLEPLVDTAERARIPGEHLSRGTRDELYLVLRVALARALASGRNLPLILDDPCLGIDPVRFARTVDLLHFLCGRTQVIIFTADPRFEEWFEPALRLGTEPAESVAAVVA